MSKLHLALASLLLIVGSLPATARTAECRVTRDAYASLKQGTHYDQAVKILGCPGRRVTHMEIGTVQRATYSWRGTGRTGANLNLSFRNGRLTSKSQLGLN
ncbi:MULTISPECIES: DUF3862 domain-containing protein [unclassified Methylobacterium]|uniref:DUF3862 domain-containing protein n=1 Tax=unclassified Methylobacterium TaxID=2615210 RepID=UPI0011C1D968|nr:MULTISPECIES: DUF3862 domain-containing protein [unclassified Methylobacterium]QEE37798.1 DUF3862 domain-containing protein [Methylobacterium sp. WL1]TXN05972.1 DUF3862 domain-containing protein [Methylobacterium sp. WL64]TXN59495.1 DUF3862 domain-containing protein [Methylobacterium sp. WL2]